MSPENKKIPATVRIFTLNCADTLERCLESVKNFDEILILDGNSTDGTLDIAGRYGARIEKQFESDEPNIPIVDWPAMVNRAVVMAKHDWIYGIDSDEKASVGLVQEISEIAGRPDIKHYVYKVPNRIIYKGREIVHATSYPGYQMRFINRRCHPRYERSPHYRVVFDENKYSVGKMKNPWYVFLDYDEPIKLRFVILDAIAAKNQNWQQFLRWGLWDKIWGMAKILIKTSALYLRHGFKETLPPNVELRRLQYKGLLLYYILRQRLFGTDLRQLLPNENR